MRKIILSIALIAGLVAPASAADNYAATAGSGLTFGAKDAAGVLYSRFIGCDNTTVSQCWSIDSSGRQLITVTSGSIASGAVASGAIAAGALAAGAGVDGWDLTQGAKADSVCGSDTGTCSLVALAKKIAANLTTLNTTAGTAIPAGTALIGYTSADPCTQKTKLNKQFTTNGTSSVELVALSGSTTIYVCSLNFIAAGATTVAFTTGTGTACASSNAAVIGSTTANIANSMSFAANGGMSMGSGNGTIAKGAGSSAFCMINGTNVYVSGNMTYVQE